jgi:hypothetical protein
LAIGRLIVTVGVAVLALHPALSAATTRPGDAEPGFHPVFSPAIRAGLPTGAAFSLTMTTGRTESPQFCPQEAGGLSVTVEAGHVGALVGVGLGLVCQETQWLPPIPIPKYGAAVRVIAAHTWGTLRSDEGLEWSAPRWGAGSCGECPPRHVLHSSSASSSL